jgi:hypothetical protein
MWRNQPWLAAASNGGNGRGMRGSQRGVMAAMAWRNGVIESVVIMKMAAAARLAAMAVAASHHGGNGGPAWRKLAGVMAD